jgi:hypothetical protein
VGASGDAVAQDAAESAIILSGVGHSQGSAQRSLGSAVANSINSAANTVRTTNARPARSRRGHHAAQAFTIAPGNVDPLEGTDAPTYQLSNGASIRVSGGLRPVPQAACVKDCPKAP